MARLKICNVDCRWLGASTKTNGDRDRRGSDSAGRNSCWPHQTSSLLVTLGALDFEEDWRLKPWKRADRRARSVEVSELCTAI